MNELLQEHFLRPRNIGDGEETSFQGQTGSLICGAVAYLSLQLNETLDISGAEFKALGCEYLVASLSLLTERVIGISTAAAASIANNHETLLTELNVDESHRHCIDLACDALLRAIREYSNATRDEWNGEEALICTCFFVSEKTIEREIRQQNLTSVRQVTEACNAGGGCGSCQPLIVEILESMKV